MTRGLKSPVLSRCKLVMTYLLKPDTRLLSTFLTGLGCRLENLTWKNQNVPGRM
jgi:hypothetical protein